MSQLNLVERRAEIITSVLSRGLFSANYLSNRKSFQYMGSKDRKPVSNVDGVFVPNYNHLMARSGGEEDFILSYEIGGSLYDHDFGVLPVVAERPNEDIYSVEEADLKRIISERANASFLLTCFADESWIAKRMRRVSTDFFNKVVFLSEIWNESNSRLGLQRLFAQFPLNTVEYVSKTLLINVGQDEIKELEVTVPDYESVIREMMLENRNQDIWIHGVRLPVSSDLVK